MDGVTQDGAFGVVQGKVAGVLAEVDATEPWARRLIMGLVVVLFILVIWLVAIVTWRKGFNAGHAPGSKALFSNPVMSNWATGSARPLWFQAGEDAGMGGPMDSAYSPWNDYRRALEDPALRAHRRAGKPADCARSPRSLNEAAAILAAGGAVADDPEAAMVASHIRADAQMGYDEELRRRLEGGSV